MIEIFLALGFGIVLGTAAGLLPGLHPNNTVPIILGISFLFDPLVAAVILVTCGVVDSFLSYIPAILFGAPDDSTSLGVLPGHKLLLEGRGFEAIKLTVIGNLGGVLFAILTLPLFALFIPEVYNFIRPHVHWLLIAVMGYMILKEKGKKKFYAFLVFFLSGLLGLSVLDFSDSLIFPVLTGLFGIPILFLSIFQKTKLPKKFTFEESDLDKKEVYSAIGIGSVAGILAGLLPGLGSAQSAILTQQVSKRKEGKDFLISLSAVDASDLIYSLLALWLIGNPRSGIAVGISKLLEVGLPEVLTFIFVIIIAAAIGAILTLKLSKVMLNVLRKVNYSRICLYIIIFLVALTVLFSGWFGILVLIISMAVGMIPNLVNVRRSYSMGVLIIPTIIWFLGIGTI
ncbi:MAG: tripartite tricarboxylate transporter permease [Candidatus Hodarchaeales archaeon]|jgi:putative membrane protein